jgi:hypothetical protein
MKQKVASLSGFLAIANRTYALVTRKQDFEIATEASIGMEIRSSCVSPG